jgi:hypothetical protein
MSAVHAPVYLTDKNDIIFTKNTVRHLKENAHYKCHKTTRTAFDIHLQRESKLETSSAISSKFPPPLALSQCIPNKEVSINHGDLFAQKPAKIQALGSIR